MSRFVHAFVVALLLAASCHSEGGTAQGGSGAQFRDGGAQLQDGGANEGRGASGPERLLFSSPDWTGGRGACTDNTQKDGCDSQWVHAKTSQMVRVFVVEVKEPAALATFISKLGADVVARGGLADRIEQSGMVVLRYLEESAQPVDGGTLRVASLSYALVGRDQRAVHLITSVVPYEDQQGSDQRLRDLLTSASWLTLSGPGTP